MSNGHAGHTHGKGGHVHATVDHLSSDEIHKPYMHVALAPELMHALGRIPEHAE